MARLYYVMRRLHLWRIPIAPRVLMLLIRFMYQSFLPYRTEIGPNVSFGHAQGIVIAPRVRIGARCRIRHQVTIGGGQGGAPVIGDEVDIGAGAKIIGPVRVGNRVRIGANTVVVHDVPDDATVVGVPARVVRMAGMRISLPAEADDAA